MEKKNASQVAWTSKFHYRDAPSINSCEMCSYAREIDEDGEWGVEALICEAGTDDTGIAVSVQFNSICDLFMPDE